MNEFPVCPYCREVDRDPDASGSSFDVFCQKCEKSYRVETEMTITYESRCTPSQHLWIDVTTKLAQSQGAKAVRICLNCDSQQVLLENYDHWEPRHLGQKAT